MIAGSPSVSAAPLRVWTCIDHEYFFPFGCASVVVAETEDQARDLLWAELATQGLTSRAPFTLQPLDIERPNAVLLCDGDY
jgi:hypothetical protein